MLSSSSPEVPAMVRLLMRRAGTLRTLLVSSSLLVAHAAGAQPRAWSPPETLTPPGQQSPRPQLAMDGSGNALVTWIREQGASRQTQSARLTSTGVWLPNTNLYSPAAVTSVPLETSDVALNAAGQGAAVWVRATGSGPTDQIVQGAIFTGSAWRPAANLMPVPAAGVRSPRVNVDGAGNAVAAWVQVLNGVTIVRASRYVSGGAWTAPQTISSPTESVDDGVVLGVDNAGNAVVVWTGTAGGVPTLRAVQYGALTSMWSVPVSIAPAGRAPSVVRLAVNRAGTMAFLAYRGFDGVRDLVRVATLDPTSGVWAVPDDVSTAAQSVVDLDIAADEQARAVAVWTLVDGTVQTARFDGAWGTPSTRTTGAAARDVAIDSDTAGNAIATWARLDGDRYRVQAATFAVSTSTWAAAVNVSDTTGDAVAPRVSLHEDGSAAIVWQSDRDAAYVQASRYVLTAAPQLRPAVVDDTTVSLSWSPGTGSAPAGYTLVASLMPGGPPLLQLSVGTGTSVVLTARSGAYYVRLLATVDGVPVASNEILVIVGAGAAPTAPQDLVATVNGAIVSLSWTPPANEVIAPVRTYYVAAGSVPGISNLAFFPTGSAQTSYVTGAIPNGSYWVRVYAESAGGLSPASGEVRVVVGPPPPGAPVLSGGATGPGTVLLQWTAPPAPGAAVSGYELRAGYQPGQSNAAVIGLPASALSYAATGIPPGTYYVRVVPLSSAGPGETSNEVVVTVP